MICIPVSIDSDTESPVASYKPSTIHKMPHSTLISQKIRYYVKLPQTLNLVFYSMQTMLEAKDMFAYISEPVYS